MSQHHIQCSGKINELNRTVSLYPLLWCHVLWGFLRNLGFAYFLFYISGSLQTYFYYINVQIIHASSFFFKSERFFFICKEKTWSKIFPVSVPEIRDFCIAGFVWQNSMPGWLWVLGARFFPLLSVYIIRSSWPW